MYLELQYEIRNSKVTDKTGEHHSFLRFTRRYSINPASKDELIACEPLLDPEHPQHPDHVIVVVDASNLKRNLLLFTQLADWAYQFHWF